MSRAYARGACPGLSAPIETGDGLLVRLLPVAPTPGPGVPAFPWRPASRSFLRALDVDVLMTIESTHRHARDLTMVLIGF